jgi:hypothetical protein
VLSALAAAPSVSTVGAAAAALTTLLLEPALAAAALGLGALSVLADCLLQRWLLWRRLPSTASPLQ